MCTIKRNILLKYTFTSIEVFVFISTNIVYGSLCVHEINDPLEYISLYVYVSLFVRKEMFYLTMQQGFFYMHLPTDSIIHTTAFVTPVMQH